VRLPRVVANSPDIARTQEPYFLALRSASWSTVLTFNPRAVEDFLAQAYSSVQDGVDFLTSELDAGRHLL